MVARLSQAEARSLGLSDHRAPRTTSRRVRGVPYWSRCYECGETFDTEAAETRHVVAANHHRFEILDGPVGGGAVGGEGSPLPGDGPAL